MGKNIKLISTWENNKSKLLKTIVIVSCKLILWSITLVIEHTTYYQLEHDNVFGGKITWNTQSCITIIVETVLKGGKLLNIVDWNCIVKLLYRTMAEASSSQSK